MCLVFLLILLAITMLLAGAARSDSAPETVTLTRERLAQMLEEVEMILQVREKAAFEAGRQDARQRCASLI